MLAVLAAPRKILLTPRFIDYVYMKADVVQDCDTTTFPDGPKAGSCTSPADDKGVNKDCITCGEQVDSRVNTRAWLDRPGFVLWIHG
jgi:hypothetical protein